MFAQGFDFIKSDAASALGVFALNPKSCRVHRNFVVREFDDGSRMSL
jgi:hypothetical protein